MTDNNKKKLAIVVSRGLDDERAAVAWTVANVGLAEGLDVTIFLVSAGVDLVRKGAADLMRMNPLDPSLGELIGSFMEKGGAVWACPPCTSVRGYQQEDLLDGIVITGAASLHGLIKDGAASMSF
jgi:predicted peroxiredoxin